MSDELRIGIVPSADFDNYALIGEWMDEWAEDSVLVSRSYHPCDLRIESEAWQRDIEVRRVEDHADILDNRISMYVKKSDLTAIRNVYLAQQINVLVVYYNKTIRGHAKSIMNHAEKIGIFTICNPNMASQIRLFEEQADE